MRKGGGKSKGHDFERLIGEELSKWLSGGQHTNWLWRSASSGSHFTTNKRASTYMSGDITVVDPRASPLLDLFSIECKHYKDLDLIGAVYRGSAQVLEFWRQACSDASKAHKHPMMAARQNGRPILLGLRYRMFDDLMDLSLDKRDDVIRSVWFPNEDLVLCDWKKFFEGVGPYVLRDLERP